MWKVLSVFAALLVAGSALFSFLNKTDLERETKLEEEAKNHKAQIDARLQDMKDGQEDFKAKKIAMDKRFDNEERLADEANDELEAKTRELKETEAEITQLEEDIKEFKEKIAEIGNIKQLASQIDDVQNSINETDAIITGLTQTLANKTSEKAQTAQSIKNFKDTEYRQRNGEMVSTNALVSSVYNNFGFAVLNSGDRQGIVSKAKLDVMRGGDKIAELVVTNLEPNRSVCDIVPGSMEPGQMIRPGDKVAVNEASLPKPRGADGADGAGAPEMPVEQPEPSGDPDPFNDPNDPFNTDPAPETPAPAEPSGDPDDPFSNLGE